MTAPTPAGERALTLGNMREALKSGVMAFVGSALSIMAASNGAPAVETQVLAFLSMLLAADCVIEAFGILRK